MKITFRSIYVFMFMVMLCGLAAVSNCPAQSKLSLQEAVSEALRARPVLQAAAQQVSEAQGLVTQAGLIQNPTFQFENQNLRPGMSYGVDVDTYAYVSQPLDILGKRKQRIIVARNTVASSQAQYELQRRQIAQSVARDYWTARGAQENRDLLAATVANFQRIVEYQAAQLQVGAISEQDFLRIRLESERLKISSNLAAIEATRTRVQLEREMGRSEFSDLILTEPLESNQEPLPPAGIQEVLAQRVEMRLANAAVAAAEAKENFERIAARPDLTLEAGYKRTELVDTNVGTNTALAGVSITLPFSDRNQGNRAAAKAEVLRQRQLLAETQGNVLADYYGALQDYELHREQVSETLQSLHQHGNEISQIAEAAYTQAGGDLLRLLDAERAQLDAQVTYVQGMVEYQQSVINLQAAEGVAP